GNIVGGIGENLLGGFSDLAKFANLDRVSNTLEEGSNYFTERLKPAKEAEFSLDYITSPEGLARGTGRTGGSVLSIAAPAALTEGASLWATGASLAARGGALLSKIPGISSRAAQFAAGGLLTVPPEAAMEAGSFEKNAVLNGMSPSEAADKSWGVFGRNVGELAISNALQFGMLPKLAGRGINFGRRMGTAGAELGIQAAEEAYQQGIQNEMAGKPYSYNPYEIITNPELGEQRQAALEGFMTMIPIIGGGAVGGHLIDKATGKNEDAQPVNDYDPNFTAKQNQMWQLAQYASARARDKFNLDIPAELIYRQWAEESYQTFDSDMAQSYNNYAGLKDTEGNWRQFNDEQEFADAYIDDFIRYRPELNGITDIEEFANIMADTGYFGRGELSQYIEGMKAATVPNARNINFYADNEDETVPADFGEGKYWIRQGDNVSYEGAQAQTMPALYALSKWFYEKTGKPLVVSAVTNGDSHVEGEYSHGNGWKFDVHDGGSGAEGALFTDDFQKGELLDEFVKYGQSLGLGMNVESLGTGNVHLDVSAAGDQWEGEFAGHNFGGFKGNKATPAKNKDAAPNISATEQPSTGNEGDSVIDGIIQNLLTRSPEVQPTFNLQGKTDLDKEIFKMFVDDRKNNLEGEDAVAFISFLQENNMLNSPGNFVSSDGNRELLRENFGEEIQAFGDNLIAERYNRFMENQKSAAEKIQAAFTELVQREVDEGNPDAMKHQQILQNGDVDAMTQLLKDANINFDATPSESQTQTESDEILNPADGWQKFSPDNQAKLIQNLKSALAEEGVLDENLDTALDNGDTQAISDALTLFRQINRDKPIQQILNSDAKTLSDDAQKFRENYLKLQDDIARLEQQRAESEAQMQFAYNNKLNSSTYINAKNKLAETDKELEQARAELQNLQAPKNFKRVSESEQLENDIRQYIRTLLALNQRMEDIGKPTDGKTARRYNKLVREHKATLENLWKAQSRYDELNDTGKTWREGASLNPNSPIDLFNLVQLGIEQTQRKLDAIQRTTRKAGENPKATKEAMRLGSQLAALKSVLNTKVNPVLTVRQASEGIADAQNTFNALRTQLIDTAQKIKDAESQGDATTAESLKAQLPQLQNQTANAYANLRSLNEETANAILQTAPQVLSKVYGQRGNTVTPVADISIENVKPDDMPNIQQQVSDILIGDRAINYNETAGQFGKTSPNPQSQIQNEDESVSFDINNPPKQEVERPIDYGAKPITFDETAGQFGKTSPNPQSQIQNEDENISLDLNQNRQPPTQATFNADYDEDAGQDIGNAYGNKQPRQKPPQKESALSRAQKKLEQLKQDAATALSEKISADDRDDFNGSEKARQKLKNINQQILNTENEIKKLESQTADNVQPKTESQQQIPPVQQSPAPAEQIQSPKTAQSDNNPLNQLTDEEFENIRNTVNNVRKYFNGMDEIPVENFSEKEQDLLRQTGMTHKTYNEFSGEEEETLLLEPFDNAVNNRLKSGNTQTPVQENPAPAEQVQPFPTQKIKSTFAQDVLPAENNAVKGDKTKIVADNGKEYEVQYKVVEANDLVASHYLNLEDSKVDRNENYPAELQPRDRDRISMQAELLSMANSLRPADLMDSRNLNQGAPIVRSDNVVLNGNGRTAAIKFAYENAKADNYKREVIVNAEKFGLDRNAVAQMKNPVLVREITDNLSVQDLQAITESQTGGVKFGASEQAKNDASKIKIRTLELYVDNDNGDITNADNRDFLVSVLQDILNRNELNAYTTAEGGINADGVRRAKRALFALAYDDDTLIDKIAESTDDNTRKLTNALESAAPRMAQIQAKMKAGILHSYDLSDIASAAAKLSDLRKDKKLTVQDYLGQQVLAGFGEESEIKKALVKFFDEHKNSAIYISDFLKGVADGIERQGNPNQIELLFDGSKPAEAVPLMNLIETAKKIAADKLRERSERAKPKQINLFEEPEEKPAEKTPAERIGEALKAATPAPVQNEEEQVPTLDLQQPPVVKNEKPKENL
ncbi:MAG: glucosaminidase domain-containing protein, partial [Selenomonadaceae bacterium]|nr:glucosaminidase domain-containing protein [Selenomonadaceae bacterium]